MVPPGVQPPSPGAKLVGRPPVQPPPAPEPTWRQRLVALATDLRTLGGGLAALVLFLVLVVHRLEAVATKKDVEAVRAGVAQELDHVRTSTTALDKRVSLTEAGVSAIQDNVKDIKADTKSLRSDMTQLLIRLGVK